VAPDGQRELYVNPALPEWLPELTITHLRAGRGAVDLHFSDGKVEELRNTTSYRLIRGPAPRPPSPAIARSRRRA
jgi:hypothetical protein